LKIITVEKKGPSKPFHLFFTGFLKNCLFSAENSSGFACTRLQTQNIKLDYAHLILSLGGPAPGTSEDNTRNPAVDRGGIILLKERFFF